MLQLLLLSMLLISRSKDSWKILKLINKLLSSSFSIFSFLHLAPNIFFSFSNHLGAVFFFFLLLSLPSSILQWHHEEDNFFLKYDRSNWFFYVGYYLEVSSTLLYAQEFVHYLLSLTTLSSPFSSSTTFQESFDSLRKGKIATALCETF